MFFLYSSQINIPPYDEYFQQATVLRRKELRKEYRFSREILPDVYSIRLPLPGRKPGPVNAYLFKGGKTTLMDTGTIQSVPVLKKALREHGLNFSGIKKIIITHGHPEHYGAAKRIVKAGGAKIFAHAADQKMMKAGRDVSTKRYKNFLHMIGVPPSVGISLLLFSLMFKLMADHCMADMDLHEGDEIEIGKYRAKIVETPGHSKGSVCLFLEKEGVLFCGDTLIEHITPNAFVMLEEDHELPVRLSQEEFYTSLDKIRKLSPSMIYSAHGKEIKNVDQFVTRYKQAFADRKEKIVSILNSGEKSVYQIARRLFPEIGGMKLPLEIFLSISEVYTTLQVLHKEGRVALNKVNGYLEVTPVN
jgi:glyoxylase-like metal-dependent hydrolase (beta-lactamase superfamily II)